MNVFLKPFETVPIDIEDKRSCCKCGKRAELVEIFSGKFYCNPCTQVHKKNTASARGHYRKRFMNKK